MWAHRADQETTMADISTRDWKDFSLSAFTLALAILLTVISGHAAVRDEALENYAEHIWQAQNGLPAFSVQTIAQTPDNYLWVGTTGGLVRFDGKTFTIFNSATNPEFKVDGIADLMVARDGTLWIGTAGGGLVRYQQGHFTRYSAGDGFAVNFVRGIVEDDSGRIWFATYAGLFYLEGGKPFPFQPVDTLKRTLFTMADDRFGTIWVGGEQLIRIHSGTATPIPFPRSAAKTTITSLAAGSNALWIGCTSGLYKLQLTAHGESEGITKISGDPGSIRALHIFPDGTLWIGTTSKGSFSYRDGVMRRLIMPSPLPSNAIFWIFQDHQSNIWLGSQGGLIRLTPSPVTMLRLKDATDVDFQTLYSDPKGPLWVASSHLFEIQNKHAQQITFPALDGAQVLTMLRDRDGTLWIGTKDKGLFHFGKSALEHFSERNGLENNDVRALLQSRNGDIWIGTGAHLNRLHNGRLEILSGDSYGTTPSGIHVLFEDTHGVIWIGTDQGLFSWKNDHFVSNNATRGLSGFPVWSLFEDMDRVLWIGTAGNGLFRWKNNLLSHVSIARKLLPDRVYSILQTKNKKIWLSSPDGIWAIKQNDLDALADGAHYSPPVQFYSVPNGIYTAQLYGGYMHAGVQRPNGDLWFPSLNGPVHIAAFRQNQPHPTPPVVLQEVIVDGREASLAQNINLGTRVSRIEIHYGAIDLRPQDELRYRYQLRGFDKKWVWSGVHRVAYYTNLPPGKYTFCVQVYRLDSPAIHSEADVILIRRPPFYLTWWFYVCCAAALLSIVLLIYREKTERIREKFKAVLEERGRVAREMHDTLLRGCTSVSSLLEALWITRAVPDESNNALLDSARVQINSTIEEARQAIWGLHHGNVRSSDIAVLLQEVSSQIKQQYAFPIEYRVLGKSVPIRQEISHHLLMVAREALFNAVRHANPSKVRLTIQFGKGEIRVDVIDDGKGFTISANPDQNERKHYGLAVMRERIESIGGLFDVVSSSGDGTRITLQVPLDRSRADRNTDTLHV